MARIQVLVQSWLDEPITDATVEVSAGSGPGQGGPPRRLEFDPPSGRYQADDVAAGRYRLQVTHDGWAGDERMVDVQPAGNRETFVLGHQEMPYFFSPMTPGTYLIGQVHQSGLAAGAEDIVSVPWPAALVPAETVVVSGMAVDWHPCLLVEVSPLDGPLPTGDHVWDANSLAQKNLSIVYPDAEGDFAAAIVVGHAENPSRSLTLEIDRGKLPRSARLFVDLVQPALTRALGDRRRPPVDDGCSITLLEATRLRIEGCGSAAATTMVVPAHTRVDQLARRRAAVDGGDRSPSYTVGLHRGRTVAFLADRGITTVPIHHAAGALHPIIVGGRVGAGVAPGRYSVTVVQRDADGRRSGGAEIEVRVGKRRGD